MTPDAASEITSETAKQPPSTVGMTTKVVKGSLWTLVGQVLPLGFSLISTWFVIRMLGAESYGVLILVALIPTYLGFADFGMSVASTKFASEAYGEGDEEKEARIVRTAAFIALCTSVPIALLLIIFAAKLVTLFNVPEHQIAETTLALRIASVTFVVNILCTIVNSPQLARLRMDLNTIVNAGSRIAGLIATVIVVYLGYGVVGAVCCLLAASLINLFGHLAVSSRLRSASKRFGLTRIETARRMLKFGGNLVVASAAAMAVANSEKIILPTQVPVQSLAYYSVAFTLANMVALFSQAMIQSLIPAFSQLQGPKNQDQLNSLYSRGLRLNVIVLLPTIAILIVIAKPFLLLWAGPEYAEQGTLPFLVLLCGLAFNLPAFLPYASILSAGRSDIFAKLYILELVPYVFVVFYLTSRFGVIGAAAAWSLRISIDAVLQFYLAGRLGGIRGGSLNLSKVAIGSLILIAPVFANFWWESLSPVTITLLIISLFGYSFYVWRGWLDISETLLIRNKLSGAIGLRS